MNMGRVGGTRNSITTNILLINILLVQNIIESRSSITTMTMTMTMLLSMARSMAPSMIQTIPTIMTTIITKITITEQQGAVVILQILSKLLRNKEEKIIGQTLDMTL